MADSTKDRGPQDGQRVSLGQEHEVRYWTERFGVSREALERAVKQAGPMAKDVEAALRR